MLGDVRLLPHAPRRRAAARAGGRRRARARPDRRRLRAGRRARRRLRLRQRAPAPHARGCAVPHRPPPGHQRHVDALLRGRRLRAPRVVVARGLGLEGGLRHHAPRERRDRGSGRTRRPCLLVRGGRLCPRARRATTDGVRVGEGGGLGPAGRDPAGVGMDWFPVRRVPGLRGPPLPGVLRGLLRRPLPRPARRLVRDGCARGRRYVPQLGSARTAADLLGGSPRRMTTTQPDIQIQSHLGQGGERSLAFDVADGLTRPFKELPPKHFYDTEGSILFDRICEQPEYYPTRTERAILTAAAADVVQRTGAADLVELGSGMPDKSRLLLDAMRDAGTLDRYVPFDVSEHVVGLAAERLVEGHPGARGDGVVGDFERHLDAIPPAADGTRVVAFLGGTIGNFPPGS